MIFPPNKEEFIMGITNNDVFLQVHPENFIIDLFSEKNDII